MLKIYNTLGKKVEDFKPLEAGHVKVYVCGPTVYNYLHVGNFRGPVFFNFVRNWLEHLGYKVTYALNFTDLDDKIIAKANEEKKTSSEVSEFYIAEYKKDFLSLGLRPHDHNPKVTEHLDSIVKLISDLVESKKAYVSKGETAESHDVNFSINDFKDYGKLSGRKPADMQAGVRIEVDDTKKNPLDFALWKSAKPTEPSWPSPWGPGRPGWHIECSAMIQSLFGDRIDIHGGGLDLMFPHHENEIAQSEACHDHKHDHKFVNYWMHWNMIQFSGAKMSKSLGNIITLRDFLKDHHAEIYKWMMITPHYRSTAEFSEEAVDLAVAGLARVYSSMALADSVVEAAQSAGVAAKHDVKYETELKAVWEQIEKAFNDDFATPAAFAQIFEVIRKFNAQFRRGMKASAEQMSKAQQFVQFIRRFGALLSLFQEPAAKFLIELDNKLLSRKNLQRAEIDRLVSERSTVRAAKDFAKSDELRKKLTDLGISVSDLPEGSFWEVSK